MWRSREIIVGSLILVSRNAPGMIRPYSHVYRNVTRDTPLIPLLILCATRCSLEGPQEAKTRPVEER